MRQRAHRRNPVVWSSSVSPAGRFGAPRLTRPPHAGLIRRRIRTGALLTIIGLIRLARAVRPRWRPLLAGGVLTVVGLMLGGSAWGAILVLGLLLLYAALLIPGGSDADRMQRSQLERELAGYFTPAQRIDLDATLDRYPDSVTYELRDILTKQSMAARNNGTPGTGRHIRGMILQ
jgi:hypothetical protein